MKKRREFLQLGSLGILSPFLPAVNMLKMIKAEYQKGIVRQPEDGETFFVRENTPITIHISKKRDAVETISLCTEEIQPGGKIPVHKHLNEDEYFMFQRGTGIIEVDGVEYRIKSGTSGFVPRATWHSITNKGSDLMVFVFGYSPAGFEDFFRQIGTPKGMPFKAKTKEDISLISEKYGMVFKP